MNYIDYFLRFPNEAESNTKLLAASLLEAHEAELDPETNEVISEAGYHPTQDATIYASGTIYEGGEWDEEGNEITPSVAKDGWHVNLRHRGELSEEQLGLLAEYALEPENPVAVFG